MSNYLSYESISNQKIHYWSNQESNHFLSLTEDGHYYCKHGASHRHFSFKRIFTGIMMEITGLRVYSMNDTKLLLVLDHCDWSKTAFISHKMLRYSGQQELKNKRAFPSQMTAFLLLEVVYSKPYFNEYLLCRMKCGY